tara:strand:- start:2677 stop:2841 length:165 start_codon:yes stop_codon:yes gene_type:complete
MNKEEKENEPSLRAEKGHKKKMRMTYRRKQEDRTAANITGGGTQRMTNFSFSNW